MYEGWSVSTEKNIETTDCDQNRFTVFSIDLIKCNTFSAARTRRTFSPAVFTPSMKKILFRRSNQQRTPSNRLKIQSKKLIWQHGHLLILTHIVSHISVVEWKPRRELVETHHALSLLGLLTDRLSLLAVSLHSPPTSCQLCYIKLIVQVCSVPVVLWSNRWRSTRHDVVNLRTSCDVTRLTMTLQYR